MLIVSKFLIISTLLFVLYKFSLRKLSGGFLYKRVYLLLIVPFSILISAFANHFAVDFSLIEENAAIEMPSLLLNEVVLKPTIQSSWTLSDLLIAIWLAGVFLFGLQSIVRFMSLYRLIFSMDQWEEYEGRKIAFSKTSVAFSFGNRIHIPLKYKDYTPILMHELTHSERRHSLDIIGMELMKTVCWFNPVVYGIAKELKLTHEFEVDTIVKEKVGHESYVDSLLNAHFGTSSIQFIQPFNNKKMLKMRIKNLSKEENPGNTYWSWILAAAGLVIISTASSFISNASTEVVESVRQGEVKQIDENEVDKKPEFKGGMEALIAYMTKEVNYPESAKKSNTQGTVFVSFVVKKDGSIKNVTLEKGVESSLDEEALRVVRAMPDWIPGEKDGEKVSVEMTLPIAFKL